MNLPTKLTVSRLVLSAVLILLLLFPFESIGISMSPFFIKGILIEVKYIIGGVIFVIASLTDFLDGYIARKYNLITDTGKMLDAIADKILVNSVLIIFASVGTIHAIIPVILILRDTITDAIKMEFASRGVVVAAINSGKIKTASLMIGTTLLFFYNMPFEFINIRVDYLLIYFATIMSVVSGFEYVMMLKRELSK